MNSRTRSMALVVAGGVLALLMVVGCARKPVVEPGGGPGPVPVQRAPTRTEALPEQQNEEGTAVDWKLASPDFAEGEPIPARHTADGADDSPQLDWTAPPEGTVELALICDDPDAPAGTWNHWLVYGLAPDVLSLPGGLAKDAEVAEPRLMQGKTSFGKTGYGGPAPPKGKPHRYQFTLYAVSAPLNLKPGAGKAEVLAAMKGKTFAQTTLEGTYSR